MRPGNSVNLKCVHLGILKHVHLDGNICLALCFSAPKGQN